MSKEAPNVRYAEVERESKETRVRVVVDLDGGSRQDVSTGIAFFDHMLQQLAFHGTLDLGVQADGDLMIDDHHTVEDVGIVMGQAVRTALDGSDGIRRFGSAHAVLDEALVLVAVDISGRGYYHGAVTFSRDQVGAMATENVHEFIKAFCLHSGITIHVHKISGGNDHHVIEAIFKGLGLALGQAVAVDDRRTLGTSTKGRRD